MKCEKEMFEMIKQFEGLRLTAYADSGGVPTIGYGHTSNVKLGDKITNAQAEFYLMGDIENVENQLDYLLKTIKIEPNIKQYSALVSFTFNLGIANTKKLFAVQEVTKGYFVANRTLNDLPRFMLLYNKCNGKVLNGLTARREKEVEYFNRKVSNDMSETFKKTMYLIKPNYNIRKTPSTDGEVIICYSESVYVELLDNTITNGYLNTNRGFVHETAFYDVFVR